MRFFRVPFNSDNDGTIEQGSNRLQKYIHAQSVQDMARLASEISPEVRQIIAANVQSLLGYLPPAEFNTSIMASKENLQNLLASAMLTGYFMHAMEMRMQMDEVFETALNADLPAAAPAQAAQPALQDPESLFGPPAESPVEASELFEDWSEGFVNPQELSQEEHQDLEELDQLNIQLEISTRMNRAELARLLKELRAFQNAADPPPTSSEPPFDITEF